MGEGCGNDAELMKYISSANIACGFHAGDAETMKRTVDLAIENNVAIGAHPGYRDRENFGRTNMQLPAKEVYEIITEQIAALNDVAKSCGTLLTHVKPHGALYNQAARDAELAAAIADAVYHFDPMLVLFGLSGSNYITIAENRGLRVASEVFADRTYQDDGSLTPRTQSNALIDAVAIAADQARQMIQTGTVTSVTGKSLPIRAETICIHGDGEHALEFAIAIRERLTNSGVEIRSIT